MIYMMNWLKTLSVTDTSKRVKNTNYNAKIKDIEDKKPSITGLATTTALTAVENKIPNVSTLVKKIMLQKNQALKKNILLFLIIINLQITYLMQIYIYIYIYIYI